MAQMVGEEGKFIGNVFVWLILRPSIVCCFVVLFTNAHFLDFLATMALLPKSLMDCVKARRNPK